MITNQNLTGLKIGRPPTIVKDAYAQGFIKACADKQVEPEKVIEVIELLDIGL